MEGEKGITIIDFWNVSCGPCRAFTPIFDKVAKDFPNINFEKLIADDNTALCAKLGLTSVPAVVFFEDGVMTHKYAGPLTEKIFRELIAEYTRPINFS